MTNSSAARNSLAEPPVLSPLDRAPKFSPPSSRTVSPIRRPLHDRSNSQTNQYSGPTIRVVEDPGANYYSKTPFPSQPSQIFPRRHAPGYAFERRGSGVSDTSTVANVVAKLEARHSDVPKPLQPKRSLRHSASTRTSDADTLVASSFSPTSTRFSSDSTPLSSPTPDLFSKQKEFQSLQGATHPSQRSTIRAVTPSTSSSAEAPLESRALTSKGSAASLDSAASADSSQHITVHDRSSPNSVVQYSSQARSDPPPASSEGKQAPSHTPNSPRPVSNASTQTFAYSDASHVSDRPRSSSQPPSTIHEARTATFGSGVRVHYPIVRAPSASSLRADSQDYPSISSRMIDRADQHQWSSQLSTIPSESERGSQSVERASPLSSSRSQTQSLHPSQDDVVAYNRARPRRRRSTIDSVPSSDNSSSNFTRSSVAAPLPLFSPTIHESSHDEKDFDERQDTITPLQSLPLRMKTSGFLRRNNSDRSTASSRPSSSQSDLSTFIASTIPAWARVYYRRGERTSIGAPDSYTESSESFRLPTSQSGRTSTPSDGNLPLSIYRPRNRPHMRGFPDNDPTADDTNEQHVYVVTPSRRQWDWTPRLIQDQRAQTRYSAWKAPSFDENFGSMCFSRQNRQIVLFCLGFLCPLSWMIASFLSLPPDPTRSKDPTPSQADIEGQYVSQLGPVVDKSFQKATWWRNLNRIMSGIGTLLIGVIIALAILASRLS